MITIIRIKSQEHKERISDYILSHKDELQKGIEGRGNLLYLSKRAKQEDVSLFVHTINLDVLGGIGNGLDVKTKVRKRIGLRSTAKRPQGQPAFSRTTEKS